MRVGTKPVIAAALTTAGVLGAHLPASAEARWFEDADGDILTSNDIERVRVDNGFNRGREVKVAVQLHDLQSGDYVEAYLNTRRSDPGPEYRVWGFSDSDGLGVDAVAPRYQRFYPAVGLGR